jgi:uncharacterized protein YraI
MTQISAKVGIVFLLAFVLASAMTVAPAAAAQDAAEGPRKVDDTAAEGATSDDATATVTSDLNLRFLPGLDATILAIMPAGSEVQIVGEAENGFVPVTFNGASGYAHGDYLNTGAAAATGATAPASATAAPAPAGTDVVSIIYAAAAAYGQSGDDMLRVATCESGLNPYAYNPAGWYGLFQFVPSTFASTPYAGFDIYDPVANANAAAWMWSVGRRGEWTCQ